MSKFIRRKFPIGLKKYKYPSTKSTKNVDFSRLFFAIEVDHWQHYNVRLSSFKAKELLIARRKFWLDQIALDPNKEASFAHLVGYADRVIDIVGSRTSALGNVMSEYVIEICKAEDTQFISQAKEIIGKYTVVPKRHRKKEQVDLQKVPQKQRPPAVPQVVPQMVPQMVFPRQMRQTDFPVYPPQMMFPNGFRNPGNITVYGQSINPPTLPAWWRPLVPVSTTYTQ